MRLRSRFSAWLESVLPWYDQDRERAKFAKYQQQLDLSKKVRYAANHVVANSRRDRRENMRSSFRAAGDRLGR